MEGVHGQLSVRQACPAHGVRPADRGWPGRLHATTHADDDRDAHTVHVRVNNTCLTPPHPDALRHHADAHDAFADGDSDADHVIADAHPIAAHPIADADRVAQSHVRGCPGDASGTG
jgi:hypothetical protein